MEVICHHLHQGLPSLPKERGLFQVWPPGDRNLGDLFYFIFFYSRTTPHPSHILEDYFRILPTTVLSSIFHSLSCLVFCFHYQNPIPTTFPNVT